MFDPFTIRNDFHFVLSILVVAFANGTKISQMTREAMAGDSFIDLDCPLNPLRNASATYRWSRDGSVLAACASCSNGTVNITKYATRHSRWDFSLGNNFHFRIWQPDITQDAGIYACTDDNDRKVIRVTVKIFVPSSVPVIKTKPELIEQQHLYVTEGSDVNVSCLATGKPAPKVSLQWSNVTLEPFQFDESRKLEDINHIDQTIGKMQFTAFRRHHGLKIQCLAHNNKSSELGSSQAYIYVHVFYLDNVSAFAIPSVAKPGDRVALFCQCEASPDSNRTWTKIGSQWTRDASKPVILEDIVVKDAGIYMCTCRNQAGTQSRKATLLVNASSSNVMLSATQSGFTMLQAVLIFTVLIFLFLVAITGVIVHFVCHSAVYNNTGLNKRRLPTLPAAYPSFTSSPRTSIEERSNSQISMQHIGRPNSVASSLPAKLIPPRPKAKLPRVPLRPQRAEAEHSYMNTSVQQPDYLEVVDEKTDKEDLLYEDPDKNCFQAQKTDPMPPPSMMTSNTQQILLSWD